MKKIIRMISALLVLVLVVGMIPVTARAAETTIYFRNTENWSKVYAYAWSDGDSQMLGSWPGSLMTDGGDGLYSISVPDGAKNIIFNDGSGVQTGDLTIPTNGDNCYDYAADTWSFCNGGVEDTGTLTITIGECVGGSVWASRSKANPGEVITVKATPDTGYKFARWEVRGGSSSEVTVTGSSFVMPAQDVTVTAVFETQGFKDIYFRNDQNWSGTINAYAWNAAGPVLGTWPGTAMTDQGNNIFHIQVLEDAQNIIFNNGSSQTANLTIPTDGRNIYSSSGWTVYATYTVTVSGNNDAMGTVTGGGSFLHGSTVSVTATAATGYKFAGWQENGGIVSTDNPYSFAVESDRTLTAVFEQFVGYTVTVPESEGGIVVGAGEYEKNESVRLFANPYQGYVFTGWEENGQIVCTTQEYVFTITADRALTAVFTAAQTYNVTFNGTNLTMLGETVATVGRDYYVTLFAAEGYVVPAAVTVTIGGIPTTGYSYFRNSGEDAALWIPASALTGDIVITAAAEVANGHLIISRLKNITSSSEEFSVEDGANYTTILTAARGYKLPQTISVTMGGEEVTISSGMLAYDPKSGVVTVRFITDDVLIIADAEKTGPQASVKTAQGDVQEYAWLSDALLAVKNTSGATITMLDNLYTTTSLEIVDAEKLTLDLNGKFIDCIKSYDALTITDSSVTFGDSSTEKTGAISSVSGTSAVVLNSGSLVFNGGSFGDATGVELLGGSMIVYDGMFYGSQGIMIDGGADVVINGGTICGNLTSNTGKGINVKNGSLTINDGTIGNDKGSYMIYVQNAGEVYINGGQYKFRKSYGFSVTNASTLVLSGGTYVNGIWLNRNTVARYLDEDVSVLDANGQEASAGSKAIAQYVTIGKLQPASIELSGVTLSLEAEVHYNLYFTASNMSVAAADMGLIVWDEEPADATHDGGGTILEGASYNESNGSYMVSTMGIPGKNLGDTKYLVVYAKQADGSYLYSTVQAYSAKTYCLSRLENSTNENLKALCVALMNYGAAAQTYFGYKTDDLMNAEFADSQSLVAEYSADMMAPRMTVDESKAGIFGTAMNGFTNRGATMSADGAFAINYYFSTSVAVENVTFYYWTEGDYAAADVLTAENASGSKDMAPALGENQFWTNISDIAAKELDKNIFVCGVYEVDGTTYSTGVFAYSLGYYCVNKAANGNAQIKPMAAATAVYSYYAKAYFA